MDFTFHMPVQVFSGNGCVAREGARLRALGRRCLVMTGGQSAQKNGALSELLDVLEAEGVNPTVYPGVGANPALSQCQVAAYTAETCRAEFVVGVGGGSVMDAAKAAAWLAGNHSTMGWELMEGSLRRPPLPLVLIGTTAGTGSEVSAVSVLTMDDGRKRSVTHPHCYARIAFADPRYTHTLPRGATVSTALDAFCHAAEGWFAPACGALPTAFAERALPMLAGGLAFLADSGDLPGPALREELYYGSLWAGMVLNACGTAFPHPMGYVLTEDFGIPHGMACAAFLPAFLERGERFAPERAARLYALCGGKDRLESVLNILIRPEVSMTDPQVDGYAARWKTLKNFERTPGGYSAEEAAALLRRLFVR